MAEIIELDARPSRPPRCLVNFQITRQHRRFVEFADAVRRRRYIGVCYGAPGLGKTLSARTYAAADDYDYWFANRYHRDSAMPTSMIDSRTLTYTPELTITARRLNLEVGLHVHRLSSDIEHALSPGYDPEFDDESECRTELVIIDITDRMESRTRRSSCVTSGTSRGCLPTGSGTSVTSGRRRVRGTTSGDRRPAGAADRAKRWAVVDDRDAGRWRARRGRPVSA